MKCKNCNKEIDSNSKYCPNCGQKVNKEKQYIKGISNNKLFIILSLFCIFICPMISHAMISINIKSEFLSNIIGIYRRLLLILPFYGILLLLYTIINNENNKTNNPIREIKIFFGIILCFVLFLLVSCNSTLYNCGSGIFGKIYIIIN